MESDWLSSPAEKDLRITVDIKLEMSEWCALIKRRASHMLGFITENMASRSMKGIIHALAGSCAVNSETLCLSSLGPPSPKDRLKTIEGLNRWLPRQLRAEDPEGEVNSSWACLI